MPLLTFSICRTRRMSPISVSSDIQRIYVHWMPHLQGQLYLDRGIGVCLFAASDPILSHSNRAEQLRSGRTSASFLILRPTNNQFGQFS